MTNLVTLAKVLKETMIAFDSNVKGEKAADYTCAPLVSQMQTLATQIRKSIARKTPIADWTKEEKSVFSKAVDQLRYKMLLNKHQKALTYLMENGQNPCNIQRNEYGKVLVGVNLIQKGFIETHEQGQYLTQLMKRLMQMQKIDGSMTFTAKQLASVQGDPNKDGIIEGVKGSTQPHATMHAMQKIGAGKVIPKQARTDHWNTLSFEIDINSDFARAYNSLCKE
jgi:hypothetical protein